jgi:prepilin-type N-terminal cleavage/methylation domain-containing protein
MIIRKNKPLRINPGFTLVEVLVSMIILALGILTVSQMTVLGMKATRVINTNKESRETLAKGMEILKMLNQNDPLLAHTCAYGAIDIIAGTTILADTTDIVGRLLYPMPFDVMWNITSDYPQTGLKTIRMFISDHRTNQRVLTADFIRWR